MSFIIPPPTSELSEIGPDYRVILETLVPASNRLIAAFIRPEELPVLLVGSDRPLSRYALVEVPRLAEFVDVDAGNFKKISDSIAQESGANVDTNIKAQQEDLNRRLKELNSTQSTITFDKPMQLGTLFSRQDARSFGMIMQVSTKGVTTKLMVGITVLRTRNRVLFVYLYNVYKDESSVQWVRKTSEEWADTILNANEQ